MSAKENIAKFGRTWLAGGKRIIGAAENTNIGKKVKGASIGHIAKEFAGGAGEGIGDMARWGAKAGAPAMAAARWGANHPRLTFGLAATAGFLAAEPFGPAYEQIVNQGILGAPHATRTYMQSGAVVGLQNAFMTPQQARRVQGGWATSMDGDRYYQEPNGYNPAAHVNTGMMYPYTGPDGSIVMGMYNLR